MQTLHYNRWAYYAIKLKQLINNPPNTHQDDQSVWADVNPIGLWRTMRCRIFDGNGALAGYAFTRNPAWHYVDLLCRRKLMPEYNIDASYGPDDLTAAVRNRFDWAAIADAAAYFDEAQTNGMPRFSGDYSFTQKSTLQACLTQIVTNCRSYNRERNGQFALIPDRARASVFTFSRKNADSFKVTDADVHAAANVQVGKYRDLLPPAFATIESISTPDRQNPVLTTEAPHCAVKGDYVVIGNTGTRYDGNWTVLSTPVADALGNVYQMTLTSKGSNYPTSVGSGGLIGFRFSRFKERAPLFQHKAHQFARGAVGVGIPRQRNKVSTTTDFANSTWDQVSRVCEYLKGTTLGPDEQPYVNPKSARLRTPFFAGDEAGSDAVAGQIEPGDVVTVDDTLDATYAGAWEVTKAQIALGGDGMSAQGSSLELSLRPYSDANYPDTTTTAEPGWPDVPMLPNAGTTGTHVPLADGDFVFFNGSAANGDSFSLPDGYAANFMLAWASPQGFVEGNAHLHFVQDCDAYGSRKVTLIYNDSAGTTWGGDVNYAGVAWRSQRSANILNFGAGSFVELTLLGGEKVIFGKTTVGAGAQISLPDGYDPSRCIILAFPKVATDSGHPAHGFCAFVNASGQAHSLYQDGEGNRWDGQSTVFVFAYKNNMATWKVDGNGWAFCQLGSTAASAIPGGAQAGLTFAVGGFSILDPHCSGTRPTVYDAGILKEILTGGVIPPLAYMPSTSLRTMTGPNGFQIVDHDAHGVKQCYIDDQLNSTCSFEDGEGNVWYGSAGVFALLYDQPTAAIPGTAVASGAGTPAAGNYTGNYGTGGSTAGGASDTSASFNTTAGNAIIVFCGSGNSDYASVTDTQGNVYSKIAGSAGGNGVYAYIATNIVGGPNQVTATVSHYADVSFLAMEYAGIESASPLDAAGTTWAASTPNGSATATSSNDSDVLIAAAYVQGGGPWTTSWSSGYTQQVSANPTATRYFLAADQNVTSAGAESVTFTINGTGSPAVGLILLALKLAAPSTGSWTGGTGGGDTGGGGGGSQTACTLRGTRLIAPEGPVSNVELKQRFDAGEPVFLIGRQGPERVRYAEWVEVDEYYLIEAGDVACFGASESHPLKPLDGGYRWCKELPQDTRIETRNGAATLRKTWIGRNAEVLKIELDGPSHEYLVAADDAQPGDALADGVWGHNVKVLLPPSNDTTP